MQDQTPRDDRAPRNPHPLHQQNETPDQAKRDMVEIGEDPPEKDRRHSPDGTPR